LNARSDYTLTKFQCLQQINRDTFFIFLEN